MKLLISELKGLVENGRIDGGGKNIIGICPYCGREGFGVSIDKDNHPFQCYKSSCGERGTIFRLASYLGRDELVKSFVDIDDDEIENVFDFLLPDDLDETKIELSSPKSISMPNGYKRLFSHPYTDSRGFDRQDYDDFEVGVVEGKKDYVYFPIYGDTGLNGYLSRHSWSKSKIDKNNKEVKKYGVGNFILRYNNSKDNSFSKMLGGYHLLKRGVTKTVILVEGYFGVFNLHRNLLRFEPETRALCTFGKKVSEYQIELLQNFGIEDVVLIFDDDAIKETCVTGQRLNKYFNVMIGVVNGENGEDIGDVDIDWMEDILDDLYTPDEFKFYI